MAQPYKDVVIKEIVMKQEMFLTESSTNFILTFSDGKTVRFKVLLFKPTVLVTLFRQPKLLNRGPLL